MNLRSPAVSNVKAATLRVAVFFVASLLVACVSVEHQGDRAFEAGKHKEAQTLYREAIAQGSEDPKLYVKAARNELQLGNLASAEGYYTRALRYGGGPDVAKELARYYVETSNYASAVRVYQYLLYEVENPQPVYNNLGTALMYAGQPFDAESYLMMAQQLEPRNPLPYLNLGLLYDQHLKQPWLAINFYSCFVEMSGEVEQRRQAAQRVRELESQWARLYDPSAVRCGEIYEPPVDRPVQDLAGKLKVPGEPIDLNTSSEATKKEPTDIIVERMVESLPGTGSASTDGSSGASDSSAEGETKVKEVKQPDPPEDPKPNAETSTTVDPDVARGRAAFAKKEWKTAVDAFTDVPLKKLEARDIAYLGASYFRLEQYAESARWLEIVAGLEPSADNVVLLVDAYIRAGNLVSAANTCDRFRGRKEMKPVVDYCENRMEDLEKAKKDTAEGNGR
jgi:tetratricopeptide (TPR) repeat protein